MDRAVVLDDRNCYGLEDAEKAKNIYDSTGRRIITSH